MDGEGAGEMFRVSTLDLLTFLEPMPDKVDFSEGLFWSRKLFDRDGAAQR